MGGGRQRSESLTGVIAFIVGVFLIATGITRGVASNLVLGIAFALQGVVSVAGPRLFPPAPDLSPERARAHRVAVTVLPTGVLYIVAATLLLIVVPASDRGSTTPVIAVVLLILGVLNIFSGVGARRKAQRPDPPQPPQPPDRRDEIME